MVYRLVKFLSFVVCKFLFRIEIEGRDCFPSENTPFIFASNHISYLDPVVLAVASPHHLRWVAKKELFRNKLFALLIKSLGAFSIDREVADIGALKRSLRILKKEPLVIFPQGGIAQSYDAYKGGVGFLYKKTGAPIVVAKIYGSDHVLPKELNRLRLGKVKVILARVTEISKDQDSEEIATKVVDKIKSL
ncbi:MAG: 1-acyl-sn-glycerol-3-phosphate acyltransferase [Candidatus Omnitrophota bacterium]|nr:MAG: 1-acyl-sn-glycerol-3-phosphate acyltransferase [Candidatus Omnitrophota bacterium]